MEIAQELVAPMEFGYFLACHCHATQTALTCHLQIWQCPEFASGASD